jgi:hypothetical protein
VVALPRDPSELPAPLPDGRLVQVSKPHSYEKLFYWSRVLQEYATRTKYMWAGKRVWPAGRSPSTRTPTTPDQGRELSTVWHNSPSSCTLNSSPTRDSRMSSSTRRDVRLCRMSRDECC